MKKTTRLKKTIRKKNSSTKARETSQQHRRKAPRRIFSHFTGLFNERCIRRYVYGAFHHVSRLIYIGEALTIYGGAHSVDIRPCYIINAPAPPFVE